MARGGAASAQSASGSFYGREGFSPMKIISQVALIQGAFYAADVWLLTVFDYILGVPLRAGNGTVSILMNQVLGHTTPSLSTSAGVISVAAFYISVLVFGPLAFTYLVGRSKRALDHSCTLIAIHFVLCAVHSGFPTSSMWWFMTCSGGIGMTLIAEVLSRRVELREIAVPDRDVENPNGSDNEDAIRPA